MRFLLSLWPLMALMVAAPLFGAQPTPAETAEARLAEVRKLVAGLKPRSGEIVLLDGAVKAELPPNLRYLGLADSEVVLTGIWGNPKGNGTLGMLVPADFDPLANTAWAVVLSFEEDGHVKDDDAAQIDYPKLLAGMKDSVREGNAEREKEGFPAIELVGWAAPPRYDAETKKLYWAKELKFADSPVHTLNYNIRVLGRHGVLVLNAVAAMDQLRTIEAATPGILSAVNFQPGHRYADFTPGTDKVASYGIAALVAGGLAAKAGFFKALWIGILAFKKVIIMALIAGAASFKKLWNWIRGRPNAAPVSKEPPV